MSTIADLVVVLTVDTAKYVLPVYTAIKSNSELTESVERTNSGLSRLESTAASTGAALATALGVASATGAVGLGVKLASDAEQAEIALSTMLGSVEDAQALMAKLTQFAAKTPFQLPGVTDATKSLIAFGESHTQVLATLERIGDIASGVGAPLNELATIYGKARVQGRLFAEDVNQLTGRGIPVIQEFAKQFGVTETAVKDLVRNGEISFANLEQAFVSLTAAGGKFHGLMQNQSQSIAGLWSTLKDSVGANLRSMGESFLKAADASGLIKALTVSLDGMANAARFVGTFLGAMAGVVASVVRYFATWTKTMASIYIAFKAFVATWVILKTLVLMNIARMILWWALNAVASWMGITKAALLFGGALKALALAYRTGALAATIFHAISGPTGWAILAASAAAAALAVYGVKKAFDSIEGMGTSGGGMDALESDRFDPAALATYNATMQKYATLQQEGKISAALLNHVWQEASIRLEEETAAAAAAATQQEELARTEAEQLDLQRRAAQVYNSLNPAMAEYGSTVANLNELHAAGAIDLETYNAAVAAAQQEFANAQPGADLVANLREQVATFGMSAGQAALYREQLKGLNGELLVQAQALTAQAEAQKAAKEAADEQIKTQERLRDSAKSMAEGLMSPLEKYQQKLEDIRKYVEIGALSEQMANRARLSALQELASAAQSKRNAPIAIFERGTREAFIEERTFDKKDETEKEILAAALRQEVLQQRQLEAFRNGKPILIGGKMGG